MTNEVVIGLDKLEHFFQQGYWLWILSGIKGPDGSQVDMTTAVGRRRFSIYMEGPGATGQGARGNADAFPTLGAFEMEAYKKMGTLFYGSRFKAGIMGLASTGVASVADMNANENGFQFYNAIHSEYENWKAKKGPFPTFSFAGIDLRQWSESIDGANANAFSSSVFRYL
jgi:hypothetical protein